MEGGGLSDTYALRVEVLPASYGDCLFITAPTPTADIRVLIDTGRDAAGLDVLRSRLLELAVVDDHRHIDLFVITHIDADHIANAAALLSDDSLQLTFGDIWFNGREQTRSTGQADEVSAVLSARNLPLNRAFAAAPVVVPDGARWLDVHVHDELTVSLLSPGSRQLARLGLQWQDTVERLAARRPDSDQDVDRAARPPLDLDTLAAAPYQRDTTVPNGASIAFLLEHRGASVLLLGDAHAEVYGPALGALLASRGEGHTRIDAVKLAHHGSRNNTTAQLALGRASHYLISSNGKLYGHPHDEALARLIQHALPGASPTLWFNYTTTLNERWTALAKKLGTFSTRFPDGPTSGIVLTL
jgi:beta-lactamase superfamily II metal-dependent hydrolase